MVEAHRCGAFGPLQPGLALSQQLVQLLGIEPENNPLADDQGRSHAAAVDLDQFRKRVGVARHVQLFKLDAAGREILPQCVARWSGGLRVKADHGPFHSCFYFSPASSL